MDIEINEDFQKCLDIINNTERNLFISGRAGTGKSTLLTYFIENTTKNKAVVAPTGVSALNISGETIHSFFKFKPNIGVAEVRKKAFRQSKNEIYTKLEVLVIDEISMVRADLLDCIDVFLKVARQNYNQAFGGVQIVCFGDLFQLPPVLNRQDKQIFGRLYRSPYFFDANVFSQPSFEMEYMELQKVYRQDDHKFIKLLNSVRKNSLQFEDLEVLNSRVFVPDDDDCVYLTTTNKKAQEVNELRMDNLEGKVKSYLCDMKGDFDRGRLPTEKKLNLKVGAQVMFVNNDPMDRWVNGSIGKILALSDDEVVVKLTNGDEVVVEHFKWKLYKYFFDNEKESLNQEVIGTFSQIPLKLAWAITIHKSQGKTFDKVIIDLGWGSFAHGQTYVALSRCTSFEGMFLKRAIKLTDIKMDSRVLGFLNKFNQERENSNFEIISEEAVNEQFLH